MVRTYNMHVLRTYIRYRTLYAGFAMAVLVLLCELAWHTLTGTYSELLLTRLTHSIRGVATS